MPTTSQSSGLHSDEAVSPNDSLSLLSTLSVRFFSASTIFRVDTNFQSELRCKLSIDVAVVASRCLAVHGTSVGEAPAQHTSHCPSASKEAGSCGRTGTPGLRVFPTWLKSLGLLTVRGAKAWTSEVKKAGFAVLHPCDRRSDSYLPLFTRGDASLQAIPTRKLYEHTSTRRSASEYRWLASVERSCV